MNLHIVNQLGHDQITHIRIIGAGGKSKNFIGFFYRGVVIESTTGKGLVQNGTELRVIGAVSIQS